MQTSEQNKLLQQDIAMGSCTYKTCSTLSTDFLCVIGSPTISAETQKRHRHCKATCNSHDINLYRYPGPDSCR